MYVICYLSKESDVERVNCNINTCSPNPFHYQLIVPIVHLSAELVSKSNDSSLFDQTRTYGCMHVSLIKTRLIPRQVNVSGYQTSMRAQTPQDIYVISRQTGLSVTLKLGDCTLHNIFQTANKY